MSVHYKQAQVYATISVSGELDWTDWLDLDVERDRFGGGVSLTGRWRMDGDCLDVEIAHVYESTSLLGKTRVHRSTFWVRDDQIRVFDVYECERVWIEAEKELEGVIQVGGKKNHG